MGVHVEALLHAARSPSRPARTTTRASPTPACGSGAALGELAPPGPRQADVRRLAADRELRPVGRAARRRVDRQARARDPAGRRRAAGDSPEVYGDDRVFVYLRNADQPDERADAAIERLAAAGHPTITLPAHGAADLGRIFFLAEFAVAVAGWALEINPFDQPNVQEAKDNTKRVLESGSIPELEVAGDDQLRALLADANAAALRRDHGLRAAVGRVRRGDRRAARRDPRGDRAPRRRSATGRGSCTRPASCTRVARRPGASCSSSTIRSVTPRSRVRATRSGR